MRTISAPLSGLIRALTRIKKKKKIIMAGLEDPHDGQGTNHLAQLESFAKGEWTKIPQETYRSL